MPTTCHYEIFGAVWIVVAIEQLYKGHSREIGVAAAISPSANGWGAFTVVVDDDITCFDSFY
jgi:hypothetical protein